MKNTYTKEQKRQYFKSLANQWKETKQETQSSKEYETLYKSSPASQHISMISYWLTKIEMNKQGLEGEPYIDMKTFKAWKEAGYKVLKGEKSKVSGITWKHPTKKVTINDESITEEDESFLYPKKYNLFHRSQVTQL